MQLKNALIGAIIGGLVGVGVLVAAFFLFGTQHTALALLVAVLVGAGVRAMVSTKGHASYLRGAVTALVAIAAFVVGNFVVAKVAQSKMAANAAAPLRAAASPVKQADDAAADSREPAAEVAQEEVEVQRSMDVPRGGRAVPAHIKPVFSPSDFIWLFVAALVAYELGRGSGSSVAVPPLTQAPPAPAASA